MFSSLYRYGLNFSFSRLLYSEMISNAKFLLKFGKLGWKMDLQLAEIFARPKRRECSNL